MQLDVNVILTLVVAVAVLLVGRVIVGHVAFLNKYSIPDPVVGGLIAAVVITALRFGAGVQITFDMSMQTTLLLAFFSTIGLSADVRMLLVVDGDGVVRAANRFEWVGSPFSQVPGALPEDSLRLRLEVPTPEARRFEITARGERSQALLLRWLGA